ncbi:MAG: 3-oxoacyl-ACP reductase FabG [Succinivibrionaceae bacterium]|nr:3-oxoacyl-ACP reductase FabG [Succinivibrionaceae bacterium]
MIHRVLITGAGTGIGRAIALKLAQDGFNLTLHCNRSIASTNQTATQIRESGRDVSVISADITDENAIRSAIESDISANGAYWGIVTNAGITADNAFPAMTSKEWTSVINTNLNGFYNVLNPCIMPMIRLRDGGRIVSISSVSGVIGNRGQTNYSASKAGIIAATKSLALELAKRKITVNSIAPGAIDTNIMTEELKEKIIPMIPLGRLGQPDEIASAVSFLFSDGASYITRQVININGGMC